MGHTFSKIVHVVERVVFPPLLIVDAVLDHAKSEFNDAKNRMTGDFNLLKSDLKTVATQTKTLLQTVLKNRAYYASMPQVGLDPQKMEFNPPLAQVNSTTLEIEETVTSLVATVASIIAMCIPGGDLFALIIPMIGDAIKEIEETVWYNKQTGKMNDNDQKVRQKITIAEDYLNHVATNLKKVQTFNADIHKLVDVKSGLWGEELVEIAQQTDRASAEKILDKATYLSAADKTSLMKTWTQIQTLTGSLNSLDEHSDLVAAVAAVVPTDRYFLSPLPYPVDMTSVASAPAAIPSSQVGDKVAVIRNGAEDNIKAMLVANYAAAWTKATKLHDSLSEESKATAATIHQHLANQTLQTKQDGQAMIAKCEVMPLSPSDALTDDILQDINMKSHNLGVYLDKTLGEVAQMTLTTRTAGLTDAHITLHDNLIQVTKCTTEDEVKALCTVQGAKFSPEDIANVVSLWDLLQKTI